VVLETEIPLPGAMAGLHVVGSGQVCAICSSTGQTIPVFNINTDCNGTSGIETWKVYYRKSSTVATAIDALSWQDSCNREAMLKALDEK
jgi:hypothetical protein